MVSNLLVVLCSETDTTPVVNTGTLYQWCETLMTIGEFSRYVIPLVVTVLLFGYAGYCWVM
jgi:hypothetical protein